VNLPTFQPFNLSTFKQLDYDHDYDDDHDYDHDYELRLRARTINHQPSTINTLCVLRAFVMNINEERAARGGRPLE